MSKPKLEVATILPKTLWAAIVYTLYGFVPRPIYFTRWVKKD